MEILSHSAIILSINSLKNELKQIEAKILNKKIALNQIKKNTFEILPLDAQHVINKSFSKEFSKLEKKKEKIVAALTQLKNVYRLDPKFIGFTGVISSNSDLV